MAAAGGGHDETLPRKVGDGDEAGERCLRWEVGGVRWWVGNVPDVSLALVVRVIACRACLFLGTTLQPAESTLRATISINHHLLHAEYFRPVVTESC